MTAKSKMKIDLGFFIRELLSTMLPSMGSAARATLSESGDAILSNKKYEKWARCQGSSEAPTVVTKSTFPDEMWLPTIYIPGNQPKERVST